ncbi:MAG: inner nuclear membrane protein enriched at telomere/subtelomere region [Phylliscum demangeonii]|nr:MAG: inner nuclear membrane protein enriched at telomere/subtelomere region [Phylliscum demangeonii]
MAAIADPDTDYLAPDFDPSLLTVPRLRSIFVAHDVSYPASAKKAQLVEIFNAEILPRARKILAAQSRTKRTSKGITDAESSQEGAEATAENAPLKPPLSRQLPATSGRRASRKGARVSEGERATFDDDGVGGTDYIRTSLTEQLAHKHPREADADLALDADPKRPTVLRKTRYSDIGPAAALKPVERRSAPTVNEDSVFSDDNPFQSGSSPPSGASRRVSGGRRTKSLAPSAIKDESRRMSHRKREKGTNAARANDGIVVPSAETFDMQVSTVPRAHTGQEHREDPGTVQPGEEFTPEEQMELTREQLKEGVHHLLPARPAARRSSGTRVSRSAPWVILLALLGGYGAWWRREKLEVGYCGVGKAATSLVDYRIPDWAGILQPQCEPCPPHAYCYADLETRCEPGFIVSGHPLALNGLVPLAPTCEPDGERARKVKAVADRAIGELRERRAAYECGELADANGKPAAAEFDAEELREKVAQKRRRGMSQKEFEDLWADAVGEMAHQEEVVLGADKRTGHPTLTSTSLAQVSLGCAARRSARLALARYRVELGGLLTLALALVWARQYLDARRDVKARVPDLVKLTLDILTTQASRHALDPRLTPEPWISVGQLRDDVLRDEFSPRKREDLWKRVRAVVEMNANVRASVREARTGEVSRVWEWIGHVGLLEDEGGGGVVARTSGGGGGGGGRRLSRGPIPDRKTSSPAPAGHLLGSSKRWEEGRPVF